MHAMAYVVLVLGILAIGGIVSAAIWGIGKVLEGIIWVIGIVLGGVGIAVGWLVRTLVGWSIRGVRAVAQVIAERRYAAARRRRE